MLRAGHYRRSTPLPTLSLVTPVVSESTLVQHMNCSSVQAGSMPHEPMPRSMILRSRSRRRRRCHIHHGRWLLLWSVRGRSPRHSSLRRPSHRSWATLAVRHKCSFYSPRTLPSAILAELDALGISPGGVRRTPEGAEATQTGARHSAFPSRHHRRRCAIGSWVMRRSSGSTCPR